MFKARSLPVSCDRNRTLRPCAQTAQLKVSPRLSSDLDQPPLATRQNDRICSYQNSAAI
jgi:hypothetical protein